MTCKSKAVIKKDKAPGMRERGELSAQQRVPSYLLYQVSVGGGRGFHGYQIMPGPSAGLVPLIRGEAQLMLVRGSTWGRLAWE